MIRLVRKKINKACSHYLDSQFVAPFFSEQALGDRYWDGVLTEAGVELEKVIRVRADTRGIFIVRHPQWDRCVLKSVFAARHPGQGLANQAIAHSVMETAPPIFPRVYEATPAYTLEEHIEGAAFRAWMNTDFQASAIEDYFLSLKAWSETSGSYTGVTLRPCEIREICRAYIVKCLKHARFFSSAERLRSAVRFSALSDRLAARIEALWKAAEQVNLPRGLMCGDMGNVNMLVQHGTNHIFNIDYEFMGPGHHGFDVAYFLSSLSKMGDPEAQIEAIKSIVLTEEYLGGAEAAAFFTSYTEVLSEISTTVYGA